MTYLAAIYVAICGGQLAFTVWRDVTEISRRKNIGELSRIYSQKSEESEARSAAAIEGIRLEFSLARKGKWKSL